MQLLYFSISSLHLADSWPSNSKHWSLASFSGRQTQHGFGLSSFCGSDISSYCCYIGVYNTSNGLHYRKINETNVNTPYLYYLPAWSTV